MLNTGIVGRRESRFDPRKGGKLVRSLPKFPPFGLLRIFALAFVAILVTAFVLVRQLTLPKPQLFLPPAASASGAVPDDGLIYIDLSPSSDTAASPTKP